MELPEEIKAQLPKLRRLYTEQGEEIYRRKRGLTLMEAGLKERPLDRDFLDLMRLELKQYEEQHAMSRRLLEMVGEKV